MGWISEAPSDLLPTPWPSPCQGLARSVPLMVYFNGFHQGIFFFVIITPEILELDER
jgi:hypothetical protein